MMIKTFKFFTVMMLLAAPVFATDPKIAELANAESPIIQEPEMQIKVLANGIKVYYMQDQELPVFKLNSYFETGSLYESKDTRGHAGYFMAILRSGGTKTMSPEKVDETLEFVSADISAKAGSDLSTFGMLCLQKDVDQVLGIYYDLLFNSAYNQSRIDLIRKNTLNGIKLRNEKPLAIASREFSQSLFGQDSPFAWKSTPETIKAVSKETLKAYYKNNIASNRTLIAATSPLKFEEFLKLLDPYLKNWNTKLDKKPFPKALEKKWDKSVEFIQKKGNQSSIMVGHFGEKRFNKDKYKIVVADEILGGTTFGSRLGDRIRTDLGLAYSIRSHFGFDRDFSAFRIMTQTKSASTVQTIQEIQGILTGLVKGVGITQEEVGAAKERIINRLIFEYDLPFNVVAMRLTYDYHGYPANYLNLYQKEIMAVTLADVKAVLPKYFFADKLKVMIVGDKTKIKDFDKLEGLVEIPLDQE